MEDIEERASMVRMTNHLREQLPDTNPKDVWRVVKDAVGDEDPREERAARVAKFTSAQAGAMPLMEMMSNNTAFMELAGESLPITDKITINGEEMGRGSDIPLMHCFASTSLRGGLRDVEVCGTGTAVLVFLRGRCEPYSKYVKFVGTCDSTKSTDTCVRVSAETEDWLSLAQTYMPMYCGH